MARSLSEVKRAALLASAAQLVAELGPAVSTAAIAKAAGVAEGTLFIYFPTKDALLNQLYLEIECELAGAVSAGQSPQASPRESLRTIWHRLVDWGLSRPEQRRAMRKLKAWNRITAASRRNGQAQFAQLRSMVEDSLAGYVDPLRASFYIGHVISGLADITIEAIVETPTERESLEEAGFDMLWKGLAA